MACQITKEVDMSCWHGGHGCGPYWHGPYDRGWCDPGDVFDDIDWPMQRRYRQRRRVDPEMVAEDLETRLEQLRLMVRQIETELVALRGSHEGDVGKSPAGP
jgi:hypothetical protein